MCTFMKLLLANGSEYNSVKTPVNGSTMVDGTYVSSVSYYVTGSLESIKVDFKDEDAASLVTLVSDDKKSYGEYSGYCRLVSIAYNMESSTEEDSFVITMALASDVKKLIESWNKSLTATTETAKNAKTIAEDTQKETTDLKSTVNSMIPNTNIDTMSLAEAKEYRIAESKSLLQEYLENNPITSTCHAGKEAKYSITSDKQQYLVSMIAVAEMAEKAGVQYQPSWNASGESCTYDWTVDELKQLAFEMETVVRPLVSKQQTIETTIRACKTISDVKAVEISYTA